MSWKRATEYAFAQAQKRWTEDGHEGQMSLTHAMAWLPYYLDQQWLHQFPAAGSIWETK